MKKIKAISFSVQAYEDGLHIRNDSDYDLYVSIRSSFPKRKFLDLYVIKTGWFMNIKKDVDLRDLYFHLQEKKEK